MTERIDAKGRGAGLRRFGGAIRLLGCLGIAASLTAGCSGSSGDIAQPLPSSSSPSASSPPPSDSASANDQALAQYRAFWSALPRVAAAPAATRRAMLTPYVVDPELSSLLKGMRQQDRAGQMIYGTNVPRPAIQSLSQVQRVAVIRDCQDSSRSGVEEKATHEHMTVGKARNLVVSTLQLGTDGQWRLAYVTYPRSKC